MEPPCQSSSPFKITEEQEKELILKLEDLHCSSDIKEDPSILGNQPDEESKPRTSGQPCEESLTIHTDLTKYIGFKPKDIFDAVKTIEKDPNVLFTDMIYLIQFFLNTGNNIDKIKSMCNDVGKEMITKKANKYNVVTSVRGKGTKAINLSRLAATFPILTAQLLTAMPDEFMNRPFPAVKMQAIIPGYPKVLMCNIVASLVPSDLSDYQLVLDAICAYTAHETTVINKEFQGKLKAAGANCRIYVIAAFQSSVIGNANRHKICCSKTFSAVFIQDEEQKIVTGVTEVVKIAAEYYNSKILEKTSI